MDLSTKPVDVDAASNPINFYPFPRTPHIWGSTCNDDDRQLSVEETTELLKKPLVIQEKLDGSNIGLWFDGDNKPVLQSRGHVLKGGDHPQYSIYHRWVWDRLEVLRDRIGIRYVLFGELLYARHRVFYDALPDWVIVFDAMDKTTQEFLASDELQRLLSGSNIVCVPNLGYEERIDSVESLIQKYQGKSRFGSQEAEGLYVRHCAGNVTFTRAKWVRGTFQPGNPEWSRNRVVAQNRLNRYSRNQL